MKDLLNKAAIVQRAYVEHLLKRENDKGIETILIVVAGVLGDGIMALDAIQHIVEHYMKERKNVVVVCRDNMQSFFMKNIDGADVRIEGLKMVGGWPTYSSFWTSLRQCREYAIKETYVLTHHAWGHMFAYGISSPQNHFVIYNDWYVGRKKCVKRIIDNYYNDLIHVNDDTFMANAYKKLLQKAINIDYETKHPIILLEKSKDKKKENYVIVAPMANVTDRHLSKQLINDIVQFMLQKSDLQIYVTGLSKDRGYVEDALKNISDKRVKNLCGKINFEEFTELLGNANFLIGTDSGHIHLAAALKIPSICILGWWHIGQFLPYDYAVMKEYYPKCIYSENKYEMCMNCQAKYGKAGNGKENYKCRIRIKHYENNLCLYEFHLSKAYTTIEEYIHQYGN